MNKKYKFFKENKLHLPTKNFLICKNVYIYIYLFAEMSIYKTFYFKTDFIKIFKYSTFIKEIHRYGVSIIFSLFI